MDWNALLGGAGRGQVSPKKRTKSASVSAVRKVQIEVGSVTAIVMFKKVKNLRMTIRPPHGDVLISAPTRMTLAPIRAFVESRIDWIKQHQSEIRSRKYPKPIEYESGDAIFVWGHAYSLVVLPQKGKPRVELTDSELLLSIRPSSTALQKEKAIQAWIKELLVEAIGSLLQEWEPKMNVKAQSFSIRQMKTRWGSCNTRAHTIRFNTGLVKKPIECLEYVVVHELVHLLERSHNARFKGFMDRFLPEWRLVQKRLNQPLLDGTMGPAHGGNVD
ncbi:MAG: SprT family zinc-dependent metalloprotease [Bacteroidetes bacterium]|nr:SprT family zinc-dependent metalloprotease [Bacteroidota bacterium]